MNKEQEKKFFELICVCNNQQQELDKYKNIVDELEKWLTKNISEINAYFDNTPFGVEDTYKEILDKLKELRGFENE